MSSLALQMASALPLLVAELAAVHRGASLDPGLDEEYCFHAVGGGASFNLLVMQFGRGTAIAFKHSFNRSVNFGVLRKHPRTNR